MPLPTFVPKLVLLLAKEEAVSRLGSLAWLTPSELLCWRLRGSQTTGHKT